MNPFQVLVGAWATGRVGKDELSALRECAPRFVAMLCGGLNLTLAELRASAERGELTVARVVEAMR